MSVYHDNVYDAALNYIKTNGVEAEVRESTAILVDAITLDSGNYGTVMDNDLGGGGRKMECCVNDADDMLAIPVDAASTGSGADNVVIKNGAGDILAQADLLTPVELTTDDEINLDSFFAVLKDPT